MPARGKPARVSRSHSAILKTGDAIKPGTERAASDQPGFQELSWRTWENKDATEFGRLAVEHYCNSLQQEGFITTRHVSVPEANPLYRLTMFSRHPRGEDFWLKVLKTDEKGQRELL
jgi:hypothetical protein